MTGLLDAKARTGELNSEALGGRNCHVWVPTPAEAPHGYAAIGYDRPTNSEFEHVLEPRGC